MAGETAAGDVSERTLFAPDAAPFAPVQPLAPLPAPVGDAGLAPLPRRDPAKSRLPALAGISRTVMSALRAATTTEIDRGVMFLLAPVFLALGAIIYFALPAEPGFAPALGGAVVTLLILALSPSRGVLHFGLIAILLCLAGVLAAKTETWRAGTKMLGGEISTRVTGRVVAIDHLASGRVRLTFDVLATARPTLRYAPDRVRASAARVPASLVVGSHITGLVRLMPASGPVRPDSYDFSFESYFDGIGASGFFLRGPELAPADAAPPPRPRISAWIQNGRNAIADRIRDRIGGAEGEIAAALVVGVRAGIPEEVNEALRRTGLYHIISISGLHMALVAGTIMGGLRAGFALFPDFASRRPVKKYAAVAALAAIAAYLFISGAEVAARRSFIMLAVMLVALLFDRAALTMRNLAISALVVIVISPHEVMGPSFQMSFAATAALVGAYAWWSDRRASRIAAPRTPDRSVAGSILRKMLTVAIGLAVTSVVAGLATAAFGAYHFQRVSPLSLAANLVAMPIVSVLVMPFAVIGAAAMPFGLDGPFLDVMGKGLSAMIAVADWFSARSPLDAVGLIPLGSVMLLTIALILATMTTTWLRLAALPFAVLGILTLAGARTPDVLVSEDGRLVAIPAGAGQIAVNRARPNRFTIDNWKRVLPAETEIKPMKMAGATAISGNPHTRGQPRNPYAGTAARSSDAAETADGIASQPSVNNPLAGTSARPFDDKPGNRFVCSSDQCAARHSSGLTVVHTASLSAARQACAYAALIVIDDATAEFSCRKQAVAVVTKRDLAKWGSAAVYFAGQGAKRPEIRHAVAEPYRPWHTQRQFSRAARGMPPYVGKPSPAAAKPAE